MVVTGMNMEPLSSLMWISPGNRPNHLNIPGLKFINNPITTRMIPAYMNIFAMNQ